MTVLKKENSTKRIVTKTVVELNSGRRNLEANRPSPGGKKRIETSVEIGINILSLLMNNIIW